MKITVLYGSKRGKTKSMAEIVSGVLTDEGFSVEIYDVKTVEASLLERGGVFLMGSSTWSDGDLQEDFLPFERSMETMDLSQVRAGVFGVGNSRFPRFCEAVDILENRLKNQGARILCPSLKTDQLAHRVEEDTLEWIRSVVSVLRDLR